MIAKPLKRAANRENTPVKDIGKMTEGKPEQRKSPAEEPGF
jgi:hypothetical protein